MTYYVSLITGIPMVIAKTFLQFTLSIFLLAFLSCKNQVNEYIRAAKLGDLKSIELYLQNGGDINLQGSEFQRTALMWASDRGHFNVVKFLLEKGADADVFDVNSDTALILSAKSRQIEIATLLLSYTTLLNAKNYAEKPALFYAIRNDDIDMVKLFLDEDADADFYDKNGNAPLAKAILEKKNILAQLLINHYKGLEALNYYGRTPLHEAASLGNLLIAEELIKNGVSVDVADTQGVTPLIEASFIGNLKLSELLLRSGAKVNHQDSEEDTALSVAIEKKYSDIALLFLQDISQVDLSIRTSNGNSLLILALEKGLIEVAKVMLDGNIPVDAPSYESGDSPLMLALQKDYLELAYEMSLQTQKVNQKNELGFTALYYAFTKGQEKIMAQLLQKGAHTDFVDDEGNSPLMQCLLHEDYSLAKLFINFKKDLEKANNDGMTPIIHMAEKGKVHLVRDYLDRGGKVEVVDPQTGKNPLMMAIKNGENEIFHILIRHIKKTHFDQQDHVGNTALHLAIIHQQKEMIHQLLTYDISLLTPNNDGNTPLHLALIKNEIDLVPTLLEKGSSVDLVNKMNLTALHIAGKKNINREVLSSLIERSQDLNKQDGEQKTLLHYVIENSNIVLVEKLLQKNVTIHLKDKDGNIPLHKAAELKNSEILELLLKNNKVLINEQNNRGYTPLMVALTQGNKEQAFYLIDSSANVQLKDNMKKNALMHGILFLQHELVPLLIELTDDVNVQDSLGNTALIYAILSDQVPWVRSLMEKGSSFIIRNKAGQTPLMLAVRSSHSEMLSVVVQNSQETIDWQDQDGNTALILAVSEGNYDDVTLLIKNKANPYIKNNARLSAFEIVKDSRIKILLKKMKEELERTLLQSVEDNNFMALRDLLQQGVNPNIQDHKGNTSLIIAAKNNHVKLVRELLKFGANIYLKNREGQMAVDVSTSPEINKLIDNERIKLEGHLLRAIEENNKAQLIFLLKRGVNPNAYLNVSLTTPLMLAVEKENIDITLILLENGARIELTDNRDRNALDYLNKNSPNYDSLYKLLSDEQTRVQNHFFDLVESGSFAEIQTYIERIKNIDQANDDGNTALMMAINRDDLEIIQYILDLGAHINYQNSQSAGQTPLMLAASVGNGEVVTLLLERGAEIWLEDNEKKTALYYADINEKKVAREILQREVSRVTVLLFKAVKKNELEKVLLYFPVLTSVDHQDSFGRTPLHYAAMFGHIKVVEFLLSKQAQVELEDELGYSAYRWAKENNHQNVIELLTISHQQLEEKLVAAIYEGDARKVSLLLRNVLNVDARDKLGRTFLHHMVLAGHEHLIDQVLSLWPNLNAQDNEGHTPLMIAASRGMRKFTQTLIDEGADLLITNNKGYTARNLTTDSAILGMIKEKVETYGAYLYEAMAEADHDRIQFLLTEGVPVDYLDNHKRTPLMHAILKRDAKMVEIFLNFGADIYLQNDNKKSPIDLAHESGMKKIVDLVLYETMDLDKKLMVQVALGNLEKVRKLINEGANVNYQNEVGNTPLILAIEKKFKEMAYLLVNNNADINVYNNNYILPYTMALIKEDKKLSSFLRPTEEVLKKVLVDSVIHGSNLSVETLLQSGMDVNTRDHNENRLIILSTLKNHVFITEILISFGASVYERHPKNQKTVLEMAKENQFNGLVELFKKTHQFNMMIFKMSCEKGDVTSVSKLLEQGFDVNTILDSQTKFNGLITASYNNHIPIVKLLVESKANMRMKDHQGNTAGDWANKKGFVELTQYLDDLSDYFENELLKSARMDKLARVKEMILVRGIDANVTDFHGNTAIIYATQKNLVNIVVFLLESGANPDQKNFEGKSARILADEMGLINILALFE